MDEVHQNNQSHTQTKTLPAQHFRRAPRRKQDDDRRTLLSIVRQAMNNTMRIKRDADIIKVSLPDEEVVAAYEEDGDGAAEQPSLNPMRPDLKNPSSCWNARLWDLMAEELLQLYELGDSTLEEMKHAFHKRLERLALKRKQLVVDVTESADEERTQLKREKEILNKLRQRAGTRRRSVSFIFATGKSNRSCILCRQLYSARKVMTEANRRNPSNKAWDLLDKAIALLSYDGMSSDDSDVDVNNRKIFSVKKMPWRSTLLTDLLRHLDKDRNIETGPGERKPGNPFRNRVVVRQAKTSRREAPPGLPMNFYDSKWYDGLAHKDVRELNPQEPFDLPLVDDLAYD
jgi:hypothetical protein